MNAHCDKSCPLIPEKTCEKIVFAGTDPAGKGGVASVLSVYQDFFSPFQYIVTTRSASAIVKFSIFLSALFQLVLWKIRGAELLHIHGASYHSFMRKKVMIHAAHLLRYKIIYHLHGAEFHLFSKQYGHQKICKVLSKCDAVIALSRRWQDFLQQEIGVKHVFCVNNVIRCPQNCVSSGSSEKKRILFLGEISNRKGIFDLLDVLAADKEYYRQKVDLYIGGKGETDRLNRVISEAGLTDFVHFLGWVRGDEKDRCLRNADIYILPSYNEGMPISVLEAMSYGLPVIATPVGGVSEAVRDHVNGLLFAPGNKDALDHALKEMVQNGSMREEMKKETLKMVSAYYPENVASQLSDVYHFVFSDMSETGSKDRHQ